MKRIKNGEIGEVYCVEAHMDCEHAPSNRQRLEKFPGGMMFFLGCHLIDLIYRIQGEPEEVLRELRTGFDGVTADDYGMVLLNIKTGYRLQKAVLRK